MTLPPTSCWWVGGSSLSHMMKSTSLLRVGRGEVGFPFQRQCAAAVNDLSGSGSTISKDLNILIQSAMSWHLMYRLNLPLLERPFQEGLGRGKESYCKVERNATSSALLRRFKKGWASNIFFDKIHWAKGLLISFFQMLYSCITWFWLAGAVCSVVIQSIKFPLPDMDKNRSICVPETVGSFAEVDFLLGFYFKAKNYLWCRSFGEGTGTEFLQPYSLDLYVSTI